MTVPPIECATSTTGPGMESNRLPMYGASVGMPLSGFDPAIVVKPSRCSLGMTPFQHDESAYPPWTSTMVGLTFGPYLPGWAVAAAAAFPSGVAINAADPAAAAPAANTCRRETFLPMVVFSSEDVRLGRLGRRRRPCG